MSACLLDSDEVTERLVQAGLKLAGMDPDDRDSPEYKATYRDVVYETLFDLARSHLRRGSVVIAGPFTKETQSSDGLQFIENKIGQKVTAHFIWCDPVERRHRLELRGETRDLAKLLNWEDHLASCSETAPSWKHNLVDTSKAP